MSLMEAWVAADAALRLPNGTSNAANRHDPLRPASSGDPGGLTSPATRGTDRPYRSTFESALFGFRNDSTPSRAMPASRGTRRASSTSCVPSTSRADGSWTSGAGGCGLPGIGSRVGECSWASAMIAPRPSVSAWWALRKYADFPSGSPSIR